LVVVQDGIGIDVYDDNVVVVIVVEDGVFLSALF
jgi:hypothetical protein